MFGAVRDDDVHSCAVFRPVCDDDVHFCAQFNTPESMVLKSFFLWHEQKMYEYYHISYDTKAIIILSTHGRS